MIRGMGSPNLVVPYHKRLLLRTPHHRKKKIQHVCATVASKDPPLTTSASLWLIQPESRTEATSELELDQMALRIPQEIRTPLPSYALFLFRSGRSGIRMWYTL